MEQALAANEVQQVDVHGGVIVEMNKPMDSEVFVPILRPSISYWKQQGKKGFWFELPIELANLVEAVVKEGFMYHHVEPKYLMLVFMIPKGTHTFPVNATHRVDVGVFDLNDNNEGVVVALKVDLQCHRCSMKVKKVIGKFPQIRDRVYNEKDGTVMVKVVWCMPEKITNKISCKGDKSIKSIRTKEPEKKNEEIKENKAIRESKKKNEEDEEDEEERSSTSRVVARPEQDKRSPPPHTVRNCSLPEGRPAYQYHDIGIPTTLPAYVKHAIYDNYDGGDDKKGHNVGQSS